MRYTYRFVMYICGHWKTNNPQLLNLFSDIDLASLYCFTQKFIYDPLLLFIIQWRRLRDKTCYVEWIRF